jgi:hypothetical protein
MLENEEVRFSIESRDSMRRTGGNTPAARGRPRIQPRSAIRFAFGFAMTTADLDLDLDLTSR